MRILRSASSWGVKEREATGRCANLYKRSYKTHKSSSWLYGGAKRLLGQTAAAINLNSHVEARRLAFHTGWDMARSSSSPSATASTVSRSAAATKRHGRKIRKERVRLVSLSVSLSSPPPSSRLHLRTLSPGHRWKRFISAGSPDRIEYVLEALNQLIMAWVTVCTGFNNIRRDL